MAIRLIFETDGRAITLVRRQKVEMLVPEAPAAPRAGIMAETRDVADQPLYQQSVDAQLEPSVEVFSPNGIRREETGEKRMFMLILPDDANAKSLVFVDATPRAGIAAEASRELARFDLKAADE